jgi:hypothetical protein
MELDFRSFAFIITLAAVVNGLGIVRWLAAFSEYLRNRDSLKVQHYWVYNLAAGFQFMIHIVLWWSLWGIREAGAFNFLTYVYLLLGPILLFLATSLLVPDIKDGAADVKAHYFHARRSYSSVLSLLWLWALLLWPVLLGAFAPTAPLVATFATLAVIMRATDKAVVHATIAILNWLVLATFIGLFAMKLGGVGELMSD